MIKGSLTLKDSYNYYKSTCEKPVGYKEFSRIIKECNLELLDVVVNKSEDVTLPYSLGKLHVIRYNRTYGEDKTRWAVDFKKSKELGFKVYFDQKNIYKWRWGKTRLTTRAKYKYKFTASRKAKRMVPVALANNVDYFKLN